MYILKVIRALVDSGDLKEFLRLNIDKRIVKPSELESFEWFEKHIRDYGSIPSVDAYTQNVDIIQEANDPAEYYYDHAYKSFLTRTINQALIQANTQLQEANPEESVKGLVDVISSLNTISTKNQTVFDFRDCAERVNRDYKAKWSIDNYGLKTGWPYLDGLLGSGLISGDVLSILGRPAAGKTMLLLWIAINAWMKQGLVPMFVTPELNPKLLELRLAALVTKKSLTQFKNASFSTKTYGGIMEVLVGLKNKEVPFYIVDGKRARTKEDVWMLGRQLRPGALFYDGAYMMQNDKIKNKWERIGNSIISLKDVSDELGIPVAASYQFNKKVDTKVRKKQEKDIGLDDAYGSDEISQYSSVVLGMLEADGVETLQKRKCTLLKGRNGEEGEFDIRWDFDFMNFTELPSELDDSSGEYIPGKEIKFL